jgi:uncharacterized protein (TIGR02271 family)
MQEDPNIISDRIVGVFTNLADARSAMAELQSAGFMSDQIRLCENEPLRTDDGVVISDAQSEHPLRSKHRQGFFARLFGVNDEYGDRLDWGREERYTDADRYFGQTYATGRHILIVETADRMAEAREILRRHGGDIDERAGTLYGNRLEGVRTMLLREEELQARKQSVETGEVRVRKEVVTETKTIEVPVSREEAVIERRAVTGAEAGRDVGEITASSLREGEEVRIPLREEEVSVEKRVVPKEEVRIGKEVSQETRKVTEDVKREEAKIERTGQARVRGGKERPPPEQPRA